MRQQKETRSTFALRSSSATRLFPTRRNRLITLIASALCGCVFNTERLHTVPLIQIRREPLVSCWSIWMLDPGAASFPTGWARCPAITGYKWQIQVCVTSVHRSRGCMGDERSRQTSAWSARETSQPPGTNMGKTSRSNSTSCADGSQQAHNTFCLVDMQGKCHINGMSQMGLDY